MHFAIFPPSSELHRTALPLIAAGRLRMIEAPDQLRTLGKGDHVLLHAEKSAAWLTSLTDRCRAGQLGSIHLIVENEPPRWESIGFRVRPWVQAIHFLGPKSGAFPPSTAPAPLRRAGSLEELLAFDQPAFRSEEVPTAFPPKLQVETTAHCGINCSYCPKSWQEPNRARMEEDLFNRIMAECTVGKPDSIELYLNGDPLTDPRIEHLATVAKAASPDSLIEIITHEKSITARRSQSLAESGLDAVFVSVNFPEPAEPAAMRARLERIAAFRKIFLAQHKQLVVVTLWNLLDESSRLTFSALCAELDVPFEKFRATSRLGDVDLGQFPHVAPAQAKGSCERPFTKAYVRSTGDVILCCEDWEDRWVMGNLANTSLAEIWKSEAYRARRRSFLDGTLLAPCNTCEYAGVGADSAARRPGTVSLPVTKQ